MSDIVKRLHLYARDDHERLCQGREYVCSCGYDDKRDPLLEEAAAAEIERLLNVLADTRTERWEQAMRDATMGGTGFLLDGKRLDPSEVYVSPAPSGWRPDALVTAANALIDFYNGPVQAKRPDVFQRLMQRLADATPPAPGKEEK